MKVHSIAAFYSLFIRIKLYNVKKYLHMRIFYILTQINFHAAEEYKKY